MDLLDLIIVLLIFNVIIQFVSIAFHFKFTKNLAKSITDGGKKVVKNFCNKYLKLISDGHDLEIDACDGSELLSQATDVFSYIDPDFKIYGAIEKSSPTPQTKTGVYELQKNSTFFTFFNSVGVELDKLCFTQHQIKKFIQSHRSWLRTGGYATFFLFKSKVGSEDKFFVATVGFDDNGRLVVFVNRLECDYEWNAGNRRRVVLPYLDVMP
jgi:hypothetical protein